MCSFLMVDLEIKSLHQALSADKMNGIIFLCSFLSVFIIIQSNIEMCRPLGLLFFTSNDAWFFFSKCYLKPKRWSLPYTNVINIGFHSECALRGGPSLSPPNTWPNSRSLSIIGYISRIRNTCSNKIRMCKLEENQEAGIASGENMNLDQGQAIHKCSIIEISLLHSWEVSSIRKCIIYV